MGNENSPKENAKKILIQVLLQSSMRLISFLLFVHQEQAEGETSQRSCPPSCFLQIHDDFEDFNNIRTGNHNPGTDHCA